MPARAEWGVLFSSTTISTFAGRFGVDVTQSGLVALWTVGAAWPQAPARTQVRSRPARRRGRPMGPVCVTGPALSRSSHDRGELPHGSPDQPPRQPTRGIARADGRGCGPAAPGCRGVPGRLLPALRADLAQCTG